MKENIIKFREYVRGNEKAQKLFKFVEVFISATVSFGFLYLYGASGSVLIERGGFTEMQASSILFIGFMAVVCFGMIWSLQPDFMTYSEDKKERLAGLKELLKELEIEKKKGYTQNLYSFIQEVGSVKKKFVPKKGQIYFYLDSMCIIRKTKHGKYISDEMYVSIGNCYRTKAEALETRERVLKAY